MFVSYCTSLCVPCFQHFVGQISVHTITYADSPPNWGQKSGPTTSSTYLPTEKEGQCNVLTSIATHVRMCWKTVNEILLPWTRVHAWENLFPTHAKASRTHKCQLARCSFKKVFFSWSVPTLTSLRLCEPERGLSVTCSGKAAYWDLLSITSLGWFIWDNTDSQTLPGLDYTMLRSTNTRTASVALVLTGHLSCWIDSTCILNTFLRAYNSTHCLCNNLTCNMMTREEEAWLRQRGLNFPKNCFPPLNVHDGFLPETEGPYKADAPVPMAGTVSLFQQENTRDQQQTVY